MATMLWTARWGALLACLALPLAPAFGADQAPPGAGALPPPRMIVPPLLTDAAIRHAVGQLTGIVDEVMETTGIPGVAVAVVRHDRVLYARGFGIREVGKPGRIDPDTVFLLASVSKPITSTIIAHLVGEKRFGSEGWNTAIRAEDPDFVTSDVYVTTHATFADMLSHRSGLHTGAGDLLEDLGFDRHTILSRQWLQPLAPFRASYNYSNFGYTEAAVAAAKAAGMPWEDLAQKVLFGPAHMASASYRHADYLARPDHAAIHVRLPDGTWAALHDRDADAEAPAGGASASLNDMARFARLQLGDGTLDGVKIVEPAPLAQTHMPQVIPGPPPAQTARTGFYGFGWNVGYDEQGRLRIGHSGAFNLGTATNITLLPGEDLGIVVLTNGEPIGAAEAIGDIFFDIAQHGHRTVDWLSARTKQFGGLRAADEADAADGTRPARPAPARADAAYLGTYWSPYYGRLTVAREGDRLVMTLGPAEHPTHFPLRHIDGDRFVFDTIGENANGLSNATFTIGDPHRGDSLTLNFYNRTGLGTFRRE